MTFNTRKRHAAPITLAVLAALGLAACGGSDDNDDNPNLPPTQAAMTCAQLAGMTIPASSIGLATTGAAALDRRRFDSRCPRSRPDARRGEGSGRPGTHGPTPAGSRVAHPRRPPG